jgi:hypothetical protein
MSERNRPTGTLMRTALALVLGLSTAASSALAAPDAGAKVIRNQALVVAFEESSGLFTIQHTATGRTFVKDGRLSGTGGKAQVVTVNDRTFGEGQAIEVSYPSGGRDQMVLLPHLPFVLIRARLHNAGQEASSMNRLNAVSMRVDLGKPAEELRVLGTGGLTTPDRNPGSYAFLALVDPHSRNGIVSAWLTHDRGSGVLFSNVEKEQVRLDARIDYGRLNLAPGMSADAETLALGWFGDTRLGLEAWADAVAKVYAIKLPSQPVGYCTWYHARASNAQRLAEQTAFAAEKLAPFGFRVVQIDDGWQVGARRNGPAKNFTAHRASGPYPAGMKATADDIKRHGLTPGIWFMPFAADHLDPYFKGHPEWFVKGADGQPYETKWGGTCLDLTQPGARAHVRGVAGRIAREWGYTYFKMDGLWTGTATKQVYVNSGYKDDGIGDAVFHDPDKTNIEAFRDGLKLVREAVGGVGRPAPSDVFFLGCCAPQNMRSFGGAFGLLDAMRIGPDNGPKWNSLVRGPTFGSRTYFLHGRVWYNDPDPVYVRSEVPLEHARLICSWVTISGQLNMSSEDYAKLPPERLDLLKRTMPSHGLRPRPVDLFDNDPPRVWLLTDERRQPRRDVIALFNWGDKATDFDYPLERIGLSEKQAYLAFDYWNNALLPPISGRLRLSVPAQSCRILAVRPVREHPQLLSTSRHITQGVVDVSVENWDDKNRTLSGKSRLVGGDPYEMRIVPGSAGEDWTVEAFEVTPADVRTTIKREGALVRALIESAASREVSWSLRFGGKGR